MISAIPATSAGAIGARRRPDSLAKSVEMAASPSSGSSEQVE